MLTIPVFRNQHINWTYLSKKVVFFTIIKNTAFIFLIILSEQSTKMRRTRLFFLILVLEFIAISFVESREKEHKRVNEIRISENDEKMMISLLDQNNEFLTSNQNAENGLEGMNELRKKKKKKYCPGTKKQWSTKCGSKKKK